MQNSGSRANLEGTLGVPSRFQAVLVTGAPASGKSSLLRILQTRVSPVESVEYGRLVSARLKARGQDLSLSDIRVQSSQIVSARDIAELDVAIADEIAGWLSDRHVIIASHAVTHEDFGARVTAFSQRILQRLPLSAVIILHAPPETLIGRAQESKSGRVFRSVEAADRLQSLQTSLALTYGVVCGCPVYVFDSAGSAEELAPNVLTTVQRDGILLS